MNTTGEKKWAWTVSKEWSVPYAATISIVVFALGCLIGKFLCNLNSTASFLLGIAFFFCYAHFEVWRNREDNCLKTSDYKKRGIR